MGGACTGMVQLQTNSKANRRSCNSVLSARGTSQNIPAGQGQRPAGFYEGNWLGCEGWSGGECGGVGSTAMAPGPAEDHGQGPGDPQESYLRKRKQ